MSLLMRSSRRKGSKGRRPKHPDDETMRRPASSLAGLLPYQSRRDQFSPTGVDQHYGSVSTALTSTAPMPLHPAGIVGMPQFRPGMQRRFGADVSTMDTDTPQSLGTILCPTVKPPHVAGVRSRDFSLHSHTRPPALHEGGAPLHERRVYSMGVGGSCSTHNPRPVPPAPRAVGALDEAAGRTLYPEVRTPPGRRPHMPDPSTELEELRRRVEEQSQRIDELQDALHTLSIAVQYRQEEPYLAFLAEHGIAGRRRIALMTAIAGVLSRAQGEVLPVGPGARDELLPDYPALAKAYLPEPIDDDEAIRIVGEVLGSERLGAQALEAHRARGLGREGHQALTGRSDTQGHQT